MEAGEGGEEECIKGLEKKVNELEKNKEGGWERCIVGEEGKSEGIENKMKELERRVEMKEREERRRNVVIMRIGIKEGRRREAVEEV